MKFLYSLIMVVFLASCTTVDGTTKIDPVSAGEVIGFTYLLTKDELKETDRKSIELAYGIFAEIVNMPDDGVGSSDSVKALLFAVIDAKFDGKEKEKAAVKMVVTLYWSRVDAKFKVDQMQTSEQMQVLKQVYLGIERGLGR